MNKDKKLDRALSSEFSEDMMDLKSKLSGITGTSSASKKPNRLRVIMPILAIAACLALAIIFLPSLFQNYSNNDIYATHYEQYPMALNHRGEGEVELNDAIRAYNEGNYQEAALAFKILYTTTSNNVYLLYAASSDQALGNFQFAIDLYDQLLVTGDPKVTEQAKWYKALAFIKMGRKDLAKNLLKTLPRDHYKYHEARKIVQ